MKILIGTPAYEHQVTGAYHTSMIELVKQFERSGIASESHLLFSTTIHRTRNALATMLLQDPSFTHLLFVDADMGFRHQLVAKMTALDAPVVGCIPPARVHDYERLLSMAARFSDPLEWRMAAQTYIGDTFQPDEEGRVRVRNGFVQVVQAGTGVMLIKREAMERLSEALPELWSDDPKGTYTAFGLKQGVFQPFDPFAPQGGMLLGEDVAFCRRWTGIGGEIWSCINETIRHVGREVFFGNYERALASRRAGPVPGA